jgi:hypothetical protein
MSGGSERHRISKLSFEMWVSLPEKMEEALHNYTQLQSNRSAAEPMVLENIKNWRSMYPRLEEIINHWTPMERCDIILLDASFKLMPDFPPQGSKLGISLELNFMDPSHSNFKALEEMQVWEGSTTIYESGRKVREAWYNDCHSTSTGTVKPFFESKYWATTFTKLTERRRRAEDLKNDAAIEVANERSRSQLKHLTVVQEIYARSARSTALPRKRMAILLWKFSQAQPHWAVGITTWQRLIPPPDRLATNSPQPAHEMGFPPLALDTVMDMAGNTNGFDANYDWGHFDPHQGFASFGHDFDDELCQDGTMMSKTSPNTAHTLAAMQASFSMDATQGTSSQDLHNLQSYSFDLPLHDSQYVQNHEAHVASGNLFESQHQHHYHEAAADQAGQIQDHSQVETATASESPSRSQHPLIRFDVNTHRLLQVQLGQDRERSTDIKDSMDDEALRQALVAASASDLGHEPGGSEHQADTENAQQHRWTAPPTPLARPHLQSHASYAGHSNHAHGLQQQHNGVLKEITHNVASFNASQIVAAIAVNNSLNLTSVTNQEDQYEATGNTQPLASFHLDEGESGSQNREGGLGGSFVEVKPESQSNMGGIFVMIDGQDLEASPEHNVEEDVGEQLHGLIE